MKNRLHFLEQFNPDNNSPAKEMAIKLFQMMIQTETVNPPGNEIRLAKKLEQWVKDFHFDFIKTTIVGVTPERANLIIEIIGTEPEKHPIWGFMSHMDVVPIEGQWLHPPFSGELVADKHDQFVWGRGALDMKSLGAAYLVAPFTALKEGWRPKGTIKILFCADEEQGGHQGVEWLLQNHFELVKCDCVLNEGGGFKIPFGNDFAIQIGEKGIFWTQLKIEGTGGHGSAPPKYETTAIFKLVKALNRIKKNKQPIIIKKEYLDFINALSLPNSVKFLMKRKTLLRPLLALASKLSGTDLYKVILPFVTNSIAVTNFHSGMKENSISPEAEIILDIRSLPGFKREDINANIQKVIGNDLWNQMKWIPRDNMPATTSGIDNPFYELIQKKMNEIYPNANLVPMLSGGSTDSKFFRERNIIAFGFTPIIKDEDISFDQMVQLAHNANERFSVTNLMLGVDFAYRIMKEL